MKSSLVTPLQATDEATLFEDVIVSSVCHERRGVFTRKVRRLKLSRENINKFWEQSKRYPVLFNEEVGGNFQKFVELFLSQHGDSFSINGLFWVIDDFVGVYYLTHIVPEVDAEVHYAFFDGTQSGREDLTKEMLTYAFNRYHFNRLSANIPCYANLSTNNFVERLGFKFEGKRKKCVQYKGQWWDMRMYGLLKENHLNGHAN